MLSDFDVYCISIGDFEIYSLEDNLIELIESLISVDLVSVYDLDEQITKESYERVLVDYVQERNYIVKFKDIEDLNEFQKKLLWVSGDYIVDWRDK